MAKDKEKPVKKKERAKREVVVLSMEEEGALNVVSGNLASATAARKWVRDNGESLAGKTLQIASLSAPLKVTVEKIARVKLA